MTQSTDELRSEYHHALQRFYDPRGIANRAERRLDEAKAAYDAAIRRDREAQDTRNTVSKES